MRSRKFNIFIIALLIAALGILSIYSSTYQKTGKPWEDIYKRQALWVLLGVLIFVFVSSMNYRSFWDLTYPMYAIVLFLLFLVFLLGAVH